MQISRRINGRGELERAARHRSFVYVQYNQAAQLETSGKGEGNNQQKEKHIIGKLK